MILVFASKKRQPHDVDRVDVLEICFWCILGVKTLKLDGESMICFRFFKDFCVINIICLTLICLHSPLFNSKTFSCSYAKLILQVKMDRRWRRLWRRLGKDPIGPRKCRTRTLRWLEMEALALSSRPNCAIMVSSSPSRRCYKTRDSRWDKLFWR